MEASWDEVKLYAEASRMMIFSVEFERVLYAACVTCVQAINSRS